MTLFRSLQTRYEQKEAFTKSTFPWPAIYRDPLPHIEPSQYALQIRIENQLPKSMPLKQLATLPSFNESRRITSKSGWTYYGHWKGLTFQTLFNLFSTPHLYPWVRIESLNGQHYLIDRKNLMNYRVITESDGNPLSVLYGGPLWVHCFDYYVEYGIPNVKSIVLLQGEHEYYHPNEALGFRLDQARVMPGSYYAIHHEKIATL